MTYVAFLELQGVDRSLSKQTMNMHVLSRHWRLTKQYAFMFLLGLFVLVELAAM
jgi:hypothetical protein